MARLVLCLLALLAAGGLSDPIRKYTPKVADQVLLQRYVDLLPLYFHPHEPNQIESCKTISKTWSLEKNIEHFSNVTAVKIYVDLLEHDLVLPKGVPFSVHQYQHTFQAVTLFNVLYSAKDYDTFYKAAVYLREYLNEHLFTYVLNVVILNRKDTQGIFIPNMYEVFPSYFHNGEIMTTAQRLNTHGYQNIDFYPSTYKWNDNIVIRWNETIWPYSNIEAPMFYYTNDYTYNTFYYNYHVDQPGWLGGEVVPLVKDKRGEWFWFLHKQLVSRYYMERLSNGLGEIPELGQQVVENGYTSGLLYHNGIPYPVRPNHFHLDQAEFVDEIQKIDDYERRVRDAIDQGYVVTDSGEHINLRVPEAIDVLGRVVQANVDSPNVHYYKDFISIWKKVLGNSIAHENQQYHHYVPLVVPSALEHYQTALRDPAFYMIWKRVLGLFELWQENLPQYKKEELAFPQVAIKKVEVDKLVTFFEHSYVNVSNHLHYTDVSTKGFSNNVIVQHPRLNHKAFQTRINVKSEVAKTVVVRLFLAPKYNSKGWEIPLHLNTKNFFLFDEFTWDLPVGESVITRDSNDNVNAAKDLPATYQVFESAQKALNSNGQFIIEPIFEQFVWPQHLVLPKGRVGGMPFVLMVYISEYRAPAIPFGTGFDPATSLGHGTGARHLTAEPLGFPLNRPLHDWQVEGLHNLVLQDVLIHHKHTPEIQVPHAE